MAESKEYSTIVKCSRKLEIALKSDRDIAQFLHEQGLLTTDDYDLVSSPTSKYSPSEKSNILVTAIRDRVELHPRNYHVVVNYMHQNNTRYKDIIEILNTEYQGNTGPGVSAPELSAHQPLPVTDSVTAPPPVPTMPVRSLNESSERMTTATPTTLLSSDSPPVPLTRSSTDPSKRTQPQATAPSDNSSGIADPPDNTALNASSLSSVSDHSDQSASGSNTPPAKRRKHSASTRQHKGTHKHKEYSDHLDQSASASTRQHKYKVQKMAARKYIDKFIDPSKQWKLKEIVDSDRDLPEIAKHITKWETKLAVPLGLTQTDISDIKQVGRSDPTQPIIERKEVLRVWKGRVKADATYGNLLKACLAGGDTYTAEKVCELIQRTANERKDVLYRLPKLFL